MSGKIVPKNPYNIIPDSVMGLGNAQLTHIAQISMAVRDMDKAMLQMQRLFGAEPAAINQLRPLDAKYRGLPADFEIRIAFYNFANIELELVQPICGENVWFDHFNKNETSLHHIRFNVRDFDGVIEDMKSKGISVYQEGYVGLDPRYRWAYFDTLDSLGFILEILGVAKEYENQI